MILLAHAPAERKEKLYKKALPQQEGGFFLVYFFFFLSSRFFAFVVRLLKGENKEGQGWLPEGRLIQGTIFLLATLSHGFHNPGELGVLWRRCL